MGILFLIIFIFLHTENSNAENSLTVITLRNSGIIDISNNESVTTTTIPNPTTTMTTTTNSLIASDDVIMENENVENLDSVTMSAALVRARREPPITIIRHRARVVNRRPKPRRRMKKPKFRYGPPNFNFGEPLSYYKPEAEIFDDEIYDIQSFKKEFGSDFNIQSFELSDYEKQPIEIDFYGRGGSGRSGGSRKRKPTFWSNDSRNLKSTYTSPHEQIYQEPSGQYWKEFAESPLIIPPRPSNAYGVPTESTYTPPKNDYPPSPPQESYQLPAQDIYQSFSQDTYNPPTQNTYKPPPPDIYQPLPNENYDPGKHNFAEPPTNVEWNSQSSYDNNPIPEYTPSTESNSGKFNGPKYLPPPDNGVKNVPEPNKNNNGNFAEPPTHYNKYTIPGSDFSLPLDESHRSPSYDYPKSSYEVPIYNSIPFNSNDATPTQQILYPPNDLYRPDYSPPNILKESSNKVEITQVRNLTNYNNKNVQPFSTSLEELLDPPFDYLENISTTSQSRNRRKHKRTRDSNTNKKQHILDTEELRQAFGSSSRIDNQYNADSSSEEKKIRSTTKKRAPDNFVLISSVNGGKSGEVLQNWEPIKLRDNDKSKNQPNIKISENDSNLGINNKNKIANTRQIRLERTTENTFKDIQVISIEKSHSHSFYAGTMSPHELLKYPGMNSRADNGAVYVSSHINVDNNSEKNVEKRKGLVFDEEVLPKNHKYF